MGFGVEVAAFLGLADPFGVAVAGFFFAATGLDFCVEVDGFFDSVIDAGLGFGVDVVAVFGFAEIAGLGFESDDVAAFFGFAVVFEGGFFEVAAVLAAVFGAALVVVCASFCS